ncbi:hypothetical protein [Kitasatospora indigofera]|uniref:hypothetical protein n=1 Tax=Kitasatospora indigofera TaxID=67307 RepID=UPI0036B61EAB
MGAAGTTPGPQALAHDGRTSLGAVACRYRGGEIDPADLPMVAAGALVAGLDTPALCELAGLPRNAAAGDLRDLFEQALAEAGIELPDPALARRHALHRLVVRFLDGEIDPAGLVTDDWWELEDRTAEERSFVRLVPQCMCCLDYTLQTDRRTWAAELRIAALALTTSAPVGPGC